MLLESLESAPIFFENGAFWAEQLNLPASVGRHLVEPRPVEPFFFLLIPLVLLAWGYGRRGALLGFLALQQDLLSRGFFLGALACIALLYLVPLIVSVLAERERQQHAELEAAHQRLRRHAATVGHELDGAVTQVKAYVHGFVSFLCLFQAKQKRPPVPLTKRVAAMKNTGRLNVAEGWPGGDRLAIVGQAANRRQGGHSQRNHSLTDEKGLD